MKMNYNNTTKNLTIGLESKTDFKFKNDLKKHNFKFDYKSKQWCITYDENNIKTVEFLKILKSYMNTATKTQKTQSTQKEKTLTIYNDVKIFEYLTAIENYVNLVRQSLQEQKQTKIETTTENTQEEKTTENDTILTTENTQQENKNNVAKNVTLVIKSDSVKEIEIPKNDIEPEQENNITQNQVEEDEKLSSTDKKIIEESTTTQEDEKLKNYIDNQKWDSNKLKKFLTEKYPDIVFSVHKGEYGCDFCVQIIASKYDIESDYLKDVENYIEKLNELSKYTYDNSNPYTDYFDSHDFIKPYNIINKYTYTKQEDTNENKKTFSQLKKDLKVGTKLKVIEHTILPEQIGLVKTIKRVCSNCIYTSCQQVKDGKEMYLPFPKHATNVTYINNRFTFNDYGKITFEIVNDDENTENTKENEKENTTNNNVNTDVKKVESVSNNASPNTSVQENTTDNTITETTNKNLQDNTTQNQIENGNTIETSENNVESSEKRVVAVYYDIDEKTARTAQNINSFTDYKENSATESYKAKCDDFVEKVNTLIKNTDNPFMNLEKIQSIVNSYCKKYAEYLNNYYRVEAQCPSLMVCGAGNFPVRKKEKQNQSRENLYEKYKNLDDEYLTYAKNEITLTNIKSDDVQAVEKIQYLIDKARAEQEKMKNVNAYYRKNKTLKGCELLTQQEKIKIEHYMKTLSYTQPFETYNLTNNLQNIRRLEDRIKDIEKIKNMDKIEICLDGAKIYTDTESQRIKIDFDCKPDTETITILKRHAYKWSKLNGVWQRQITNNALYDTKNLLLPKLIEAGYEKIKSDMESVSDDASDTENNVVILEEDNTKNGNNSNNNTSEEATNTGYNVADDVVINNTDTEENNNTTKNNRSSRPLPANRITVDQYNKLPLKFKKTIDYIQHNQSKLVIFKTQLHNYMFLDNAVKYSKILNIVLQKISYIKDFDFYYIEIDKSQIAKLITEKYIDLNCIMYVENLFNNIVENNTTLSQADTNILLENFDKLDKKLQNIVALTYQNKDKYVVFENGDFVELYLNNAISISKNLNLTLISIDNKFNLQSIKVDDKHFYQTGITKLQYQNLLDNGTLKQDDIIFIPEECNDYQINYIYEAVQNTKQDIQNMFSEDTITADTSKKRQQKNNNKKYVTLCNKTIKNAREDVKGVILDKDNNQYCTDLYTFIQFKHYVPELQPLHLENDTIQIKRGIKILLSEAITEIQLSANDIEIIKNIDNTDYTKKVLKSIDKKLDTENALCVNFANTIINLERLKNVSAVMDIENAKIKISSKKEFITFEDDNLFIAIFSKRQCVYTELNYQILTNTLTDELKQQYNITLPEIKEKIKLPKNIANYVEFCEKLINSKDNIREEHKQVVVQNNTQYCLDGFKMIKFKKHITELEPLQKGIESTIDLENIVKKYKSDENLVELTERDMKILNNINNNISYAKKVLKTINGNDDLIKLQIANTVLNADNIKIIASLIDFNTAKVYSDSQKIIVEDDNILILIMGVRGEYIRETKTFKSVSETLEAYTLITEKTMSEKAQEIYDELSRLKQETKNK